MNEREYLAERFEEHRSHLRAVAANARLVERGRRPVQEARLRLSRADTTGIDNWADGLEMWVDEQARVITHHVAASLFPNWVGTDQQREAVLEGDRLTLSTRLTGTKVRNGFSG